MTDDDEEAISRAGRHDYDIIIPNSDPWDMSGQEFLLRFRRAAIPIPILVLSDADFIAEVSKGFGFGADEYVTVPATRDVVMGAMRGVVNRWRGLDRPGQDT